MYFITVDSRCCDYRLVWDRLGNTHGFENLADFLHEVLIGDPNGNRIDDILAYSFNSGKWFLATFGGQGSSSSFSLKELQQFGQIVTP